MIITDTSRLQVTQRRVQTSSRLDAPSATLSVRVRVTRSALRSTAFLDDTLVQSRDTHTPMPTRPRELSGRMIPSYVVSGFIIEESLVNWKLTLSTVRVPREPKEVHSRNKDGFRWIEEGEGQERFDHVSKHSMSRYCDTNIWAVSLRNQRNK